MDRSYFVYAAGAVLLLSVWGFSDNLIWNVHQPSNGEPKFVIHGAFCLAWMSLFFVQASLVRVRRVALHRSLGVVGAVVALGVVASTAYVFWEVRRPWSDMSVFGS